MLGQDAAVAKWVGEKYGGTILGPQWAPGIVDNDGQLRGGFIIRANSGTTCELTVYSDQALTHGIARALFRYIFDALGFVRCVIHTAKSNRIVKRAVPKLGFRFEGTARNFYGQGEDALQFSMTPQTCRWLKTPGTPDGRIQKA